MARQALTLIVRRAVHVLAGLSIFLLFAQMVAAQTVTPAQREIEALIAEIGRSSCHFERNGSWYSATKAQSHLQRKYDYLRKREMAGTAEQFIERAASRSSLSGKEYRVRCPGQAVQPSAAWFNSRLRALRAAAPRR